MELTLKQTQSILHNLNLTESIDTTILDKLLASNLLQKDTWINQNGEPVNYSNEKEHLLALRKKVKSGILDVVYKNTKLSYGRVYANRSLSLGSIRREVRHTLAKDKYTDIDICNAHPVLLLQLCKHNDIECENLELYVKKRDKYLQLVMKTYDVDRDAAKQLFIRLLYFGSFENWKDDNKVESEEELKFIKCFTKELKYIGKDIVDANPKLLKQIQKTGKTNPTATLVSVVLQEHERRCLESVYKHLLLKKCILHNAVLCFDGVMIEKSKYYPSLLDELAETVKDDTGFKVSFTTKDMDQGYSKELEKVVDMESFEYQASIFEETHCKIVKKGLYLLHENNKISSYTPTQLKESYEHMSFKGDGKDQIFIRKWMTGNNAIRKYSDMDMFPPPLKAPETCYNLWTPFDGSLLTDKPNEKGLKLFLNHIKIICNHEDVVYNYFIKWIGHMIQFPAIKPGVCIMIIGKKGDGKSTVVNAIRRVMGTTKVLETTNPGRDVWGPFNPLMMDAYLVNINELSKKDFIEGEGHYKAIVTDGTITINKKGVNAFDIKSFHRVIGTSNSEVPFKVSEDERRSATLRASDELLGNKKYFDTLYAALDDKGTIKALYDYFSTIPDLENFHKESAPITEHQKELAKLDRSPIEQFVMDLVEDKNSGVLEYTNKSLYEKFREFVDDNDIEYKCSNVKFGVNLTLAKIAGITNATAHNARSKSLDVKAIRKHFKMDVNPFKRKVVEDNDSDSD
jgi:energy-coupling factor transporter ATP-binding protein EcfA2